MHFKHNIWLIVLIIIFAFFGLMIFSQQAQKREFRPTPSPSNVTLDQILPSVQSPDTLPQNTLEIPQDKWGEKYPELAQRVLGYFKEQGVTVQTIPIDKKELYQKFLQAWGKPWRVDFLKNEITKDELQLIWDQTLIVQANTPQELTEAKKLVEQRLAEIKPPVELSDKADLSEHFAKEADLEQAINEGKLVEIKTTNIKPREKLYAKPQLTKVLEQDIDPQLTQYKLLFEIVSAVRSLELQTLLRKLGYHAVKVSFHTKGQAVDLTLTADTTKKFDEFLKQPIKEGDQKTRLDLVDELFQQGIQPTLPNLVKNKVLPESQELVVAFNTLQQSVVGKMVEIIDKTAFGIRFDKGKVNSFTPSFQLQYIGQ